MKPVVQINATFPFYTNSWWLVLFSSRGELITTAEEISAFTSELFFVHLGHSAGGVWVSQGGGQVTVALVLVGGFVSHLPSVLQD